jgi:hypothetical protein
LLASLIVGIAHLCFDGGVASKGEGKLLGGRAQPFR